MKYYILDEHGNPKPEPDLARWARWQNENPKTIALDKVGEAVVSTTFLPECDDQFPIFWETKVFGGRKHMATDREGGTREQALAMHQRMIDRLRNED